MAAVAGLLLAPVGDDWGTDWRQHFSVMMLNGREGNEVRLDGAEIVGPARFAGVPGGIRTVQLTVAVPAGEGGATVRPIAFEIAAEQDAATRVVEKSTFVLP